MMPVCVVYVQMENLYYEIIKDFFAVTACIYPSYKRKILWLYQTMNPVLCVAPNTQLTIVTYTGHKFYTSVKQKNGD